MRFEFKVILSELVAFLSIGSLVACGAHRPAPAAGHGSSPSRSATTLKQPNSQRPVLRAAPARRFQPRRVVPAQPAIKNAPVIAGNQVRQQVVDTELVLGVVVGGQARAYPINMLTGPSREIINDTLGGKAIAATW